MKFKSISLFLSTLGLSLCTVFPSYANSSWNSEFDFFRAADDPTDFHTDRYTNEDGTDAGYRSRCFSTVRS